MATHWYRDGTITVTNGSRDVVGVNTNWVDAGNKPLAGDMLLVGQQTYEIEAITDNEHITLHDAFNGQAGANKPYAIVRNTSINISTRLAAAVSAAINDKQQYLNELNSFLTSSEDSITMHDSIGNPIAVIPLRTLKKEIHELVDNGADIGGKVQNVRQYMEKAALWASAASDVEVERGLYSARAYAEQAASKIGQVDTLIARVEQVKDNAEREQTALAGLISTVQGAENRVQELATQAQRDKDNASASKTAAQDSAAQAIAQVTKASEWAEKAHLTPVSTDPDGTKHYSALHWARESHAGASSAEDTLTNVKTVQSEIGQIKTSIDTSHGEILAAKQQVDTVIEEGRQLAATIQVEQKGLEDKIAAANTQFSQITNLAVQVADNKTAVDKAVQIANNLREIWTDGGAYTPTSGNEYPTPAAGVTATVYLIGGLGDGNKYTFTTGNLIHRSVSDADALVGFKSTTGFFWQIIKGGDGSVSGQVGTGIENINGKSGRTITLTAQDVGAAAMSDIEAAFRKKNDFDFTNGDIEIGDRAIKSGNSTFIRKNANAYEFGDKLSSVFFNLKFGEKLQAKFTNAQGDEETKSLAWTSDIEDIKDDFVLLTGSDNLTGGIGWKADKQPSTPMLSIQSSATQGAKHTFSKITPEQGGNTWWQTFQNDAYRIATGSLDSVELLKLTQNGELFIGGDRAYTEGNKPTPESLGALSLDTRQTITAPKTMQMADQTMLSLLKANASGVINIRMQRGTDAPKFVGLRADGKLGFGGSLLDEVVLTTKNLPSISDLGGDTTQNYDLRYLSLSGGKLKGNIDLDNNELRVLNYPVLKSDGQSLLLGNNAKDLCLQSRHSPVYKKPDGTDVKLYSEENKPTAQDIGLPEIHVVTAMPDSPIDGHVYLVTES